MQQARCAFVYTYNNFSQRLIELSRSLIETHAAPITWCRRCVLCDAPNLEVLQLSFSLE
jgi:hypothetical protein